MMIKWINDDILFFYFYMNKVLFYLTQYVIISDFRKHFCNVIVREKLTVSTESELFDSVEGTFVCFVSGFIFIS